jgi:hypothetical protein
LKAIEEQDPDLVGDPDLYPNLTDPSGTLVSSAFFTRLGGPSLDPLSCPFYFKAIQILIQLWIKALPEW